MEIWGLMRVLEDRVDDIFGDRLVCLGLQGSYARGEATEESDIDAVLILDEVSMDDIHKYREMLKWLPHRDRVNGFVSGKRELENWERSELFNFCKDTEIIRGSLEFAEKLVGPEDVRRTVRIGACNLYRNTMYCAMHERSMGALLPLYKAAFFVLRSHFYAENGIYLHSHRELMECMTGAQRQLLHDAAAVRNGTETDEFDDLIQRLLQVSSDLISRCGEPA